MFEYSVSIGSGTLTSHGTCDEAKARELVGRMAFKYEGPICSVENGCFTYQGEIVASDAELFGVSPDVIEARPAGILAQLIIRNI
jgi:hypothetical protein